MDLPVVDVAPLLHNDGERSQAARRIGEACERFGFFYAAGHGIEPGVQQRLEAAARAFFARDLDAKMTIAMERGGRAWRGYFPVGAELTRGTPDRKEGLYFGQELGPEDPRVRAGWPLHGQNLFPEGDEALRAAVLEYIDALSGLGHGLMRGIALSLGLDASAFEERYTRRPLVLFRIFHYPPATPEDDAWGVGEHTDYGLLTILKQDATGGLQVRSERGWMDVPALENALVCNIGDMLERLSRGRFRSTPHRVRNTSGRSRLSYPFFFDPAFDAPIVPLPLPAAMEARSARWDGERFDDLEGTYGDYVLRKVARVFPQLHRDVIG